jgi:hypothetical protein
MWSNLFGRKKEGTANKSKPVGLTFRDGKAAIEYIGKFMKTDWMPGSVVTGMAGPILFESGVLAVPVLIPNGDRFEEITSMTYVRAVSMPTKAPLAVNPNTSLQELGIAEGDLVAVYLADGAPPEMSGMTSWIAFITARLEPTYDMAAGGWKMTHRYEI